MRTEDALPRDPRLDPFRDAVWELSHEGTVEAHLVTNVGHFRYWPFGRKRHDSVWFKVCWLDGRHDMPEDDYGPEWYFVSDLEQGKFEVSGRRFDARPVEGPRRHELWEQYGPSVNSKGRVATLAAHSALTICGMTGNRSKRPERGAAGERADPRLRPRPGRSAGRF